MKKIMVFGATGGTGKEVVAQLLQAGHQVTAVVRQPGAMTHQHSRLTIITGDVLQPGTFENVVSGYDAVVSCLGIRKQEPTTVYSAGVENILKAMKNGNVRRIICISAGAVVVLPDSSRFQQFVIKYILQRLFRHAYADMLRMEKTLSESVADWTVIRAPRLMDTKLTRNYRIAINEHLRNPSKISRADLANYIVAHLTDPKIYRARIEISY